jgi:hypothetical protein
MQIDVVESIDDFKEVVTTSKCIKQGSEESLVAEEKGSDSEDSTVETQMRFIVVLRNLGRYRRNPSKMMTQLGKSFRWCCRYEEVVSDGLCSAVDIAVVGNEGTLPFGMQYVLQLYSAQKWWDWVFIRRSSTDETLGLFAARDFSKGHVLGYYTAPTIWTAASGGGRPPRSIMALQDQGLRPSVRAVYINNPEGKWSIVDPPPNVIQEAGCDKKHPLFMGMHFIKSPCSHLCIGSKEYKAAQKAENVSIDMFGVVRCTKKIFESSEIFRIYCFASSDNEGTTEVVDVVSRQQSHKRTRRNF